MYYRSGTEYCTCARDIHFVFTHCMVELLGTADRTTPFPVGSNPGWLQAAILENFKWPNLLNTLSDSQTILCSRTVICNDGDWKHFTREGH